MIWWRLKRHRESLNKTLMQTKWKNTVQISSLKLQNLKLIFYWYTKCNKKKMSHLLGASRMKVIYEDRGWIATFFPLAALWKYLLSDHCLISINITMATIDMKHNISLDTSAPVDLAFSMAVVISIACTAQERILCGSCHISFVPRRVHPSWCWGTTRWHSREGWL